MKKTLIKLAVVVIILLLAFSSYLLANNKVNKEKILSQLVAGCLVTEHYSPLDLDDRFSATAFKLYIKGLDPAKKFFCQSDIDALSLYKNKIDNELNDGSTDLLDTATTTLRKRIQEVQGFYTTLLSQPFIYNDQESLELDPEKRSYSKDKAEFKELWRKLLKNQTINVYLQLAEQNKDQAKVKRLYKTMDPKLEAEARKKVTQDIQRILTRLLKETRVEQMERYLDSVSMAFDPHTNYYSPQMREEFDIEMSGTLEGIGAQLKEQEGGDYIKVDKVIPGSPAWRSKELKEGDLIMKVAEGNGEPLDIANMRLNDVVKLIRGKKGTTVKLTVKRPTGQINVIPLVRDVVALEESYAKSAVIRDDKLGKTFGYISLPSFYRDFKNENARNSGDDIQKELEKLNKQNVSGIILDLRNNGGGALTDAIKISGLFIEDGPIVQVRDGKGKIEVYNDEDSNVTYQGPLVVLVNSLSASASEILAAALQDYGRAVIVGANTFGKGTVQNLEDLDRYNSPSLSLAKPLGSLKLTIQKFYRVNGGSTQYKGVAPDIQLPDQLSYYDIGEKALDNYLPYDTIRSVPIKRWGQKINLVNLKANSDKRINSNRAFSLIRSNVAQLEKRKNETVQPLELKRIVADQELIKIQTNKLKDIQTEKTYLKVAELGKTSENNKEWVQQINKDVYIEEAMLILNDTLK